MSALMNSFHKLRILFNASPDQKECGADVVLRQHIQNPGRIARMRTVVKGEGKSAAGDIRME